jgi:hypothetical protein
MKNIELLNVKFKYVSSAKTNVLETLKRFGFVPPSEDIKYQKKWHRVRNSAAINDGVKN